MTRYTTRFFTLLTCMFWGVAAQALPPSTLGATPTLGGGMFSTGGGITAAAEIQQIRGKTYVCGVWARSEKLSALVDDQVRSIVISGSVFVGRTTIMRDLTKFNQVAPVASYAGANANCAAVTGAIPQGALQIRFPRRTIPLGSARSAGGMVRFGSQAQFKPSWSENPAYHIDWSNR